MISLKSVVVGIFVSLISLFSIYSDAFAQTGRSEGWNMGPGMMGGWGMGWFGGIFMMLFWILILIGLVFVIKWLIQSTSRAKNSGQGGYRALEILKERYARGEIDKAQFEDMKRDLAD
jgi:putative membrane protein